MTPKRFQQIDELYQAALDEEDEERDSFLNRTCSGDEELRREVESLLEAYKQAGSFILEPALLCAARSLAQEQAASIVGHTLSHYRIESLLGTGGMGEVYLAEDTNLSRKVAIKLLPASLSNNEDQLHRFEREAHAASGLNHPNIVTIYETGQTEGRHYTATEFVDGITLREKLTHERMALEQVLDVSIQLASALAAAHQAGIIHRDIKPENIMLRHDGIVKILDFGLAKLTWQEGTSNRLKNYGPQVDTDPGLVMGTAPYISPEQARALEIDSRTDIWSLGVLLYEMVSGNVPFTGETSSHVVVAILEHTPLPLRDEFAVPTKLDAIIAKTLNKNREERYQSAVELVVDLKNLRDEITVESRVKQLNANEDDTSLKKVGGNRTQTSGVLMTQLSSSTRYLIDGIQRHKTTAVFASTTATVVLGLLLYLFAVSKSEGGPIDSVAVLPFVNGNSDPNTEYLSDGISDSVIERLDRLPEIRVISLSTVLHYKGQEVDPQAVGRELNVRAVLTGRVVQHGDDLSITAELVDVRDNRRLWGERYTAKLSQILSVQDQIAKELTITLRPQLTPPEQQILAKRYTENTDAYNAYLRGRYLWQRTTLAATKKSIEYFEEAIKLDPNYAPAYAGLAYTHWALGEKNENPSREATWKAKEAATKALAIDETLAEAHAILGFIRFTDWEWEEAEKSFKRALQLNPNSGIAHEHYANYFRVMRRFDEAIAESKRAVELEPTSIFFNRSLAINLYYARRYNEVIEQCQKTLELDPNMASLYRWIGQSYESQALYDKAIEAYLKTDETLRFGPTGQASLRDAYRTSGWHGYLRKAVALREQAQQKFPYALARNYAGLGDKERAFVWLEKSYQEHKWSITTLNADPAFDEYRSDPRYIDLIRRMHLEP